ncbi:MAG TPA: GtrA family protein [Kiloniellales bacterium]
MIERVRHAIRLHGVRGTRFAIVGALNTGIDIAVFSVAFYGLGWPLLVANAAGFVLGVSNSYVLNKVWTFADRSTGREAWVRGLVFLATSLIGLGLGSLSIWLLAKAMPAILAKVATVGVTFVWNYWASGRFVFRRP